MGQESGELFRKEFILCNVKPNEKVIVLSGPHSRADYITAAFDALESLKVNAFGLTLSSWSSFPSVGKTPLSKLPVAVETLESADFVIDLYFLLHSPEERTILSKGTRILLIIETEEALKRLFPTQDLRKRTEAAVQSLQSAKQLKITNPAGTNLTMEVGEFATMGQYGYTDTPGRWDNWMQGSWGLGRTRPTA